jgi:hypothetical protein
MSYNSSLKVNLTDAYKKHSDLKPRKYPEVSADSQINWQHLGVNTKTSKQALNTLMDSLHEVIRYDGVPNKILAKSPVLSDKMHSLRMPKYFEKVLNSFDSKVKVKYKEDIKALHAKVYLKSLLHEMGEILIEFSTLGKQLNGEETEFSDDRRHALEMRIAKTFMNLAFIAADKQDQEIFSKPLQHFRALVKDKVGFQALTTLENKFNNKNINQLLGDKNIDCNIVHNEAQKYIKLFEEVETKVGADDNLVKILDSWEGNECYNSRADTSNQSLDRTLSTFKKATKYIDSFAGKLGSDFENNPFKIELFYKTCAGVFDYLKNICNSVSKAKIDKLLPYG